MLLKIYKPHVCTSQHFKYFLFNICTLASELDNYNDHGKKAQAFSNNNSPGRDKTDALILTAKSSRSGVIHSRADSVALKRSDRRILTKSNTETNQCPLCPHCQRLTRIDVDKLQGYQPVWITQAPERSEPHIILDNYDEEAVKEGNPQQNDRLAVSYDYSPHLVIHEEDNRSRMSGRYVKLPSISKSGSISPTSTPFPNYPT